MFWTSGPLTPKVLMRPNVWAAMENQLLGCWAWLACLLASHAKDQPRIHQVQCLKSHL